MEELVLFKTQTSDTLYGEFVKLSHLDSELEEVAYCEGTVLGRPYVNWIAGRAYSIEDLDIQISMLKLARTKLEKALKEKS